MKNAFLYFDYINADNGEDTYKEILTDQLSVLDAVEDRLDKESVYNPIKILGFPVTPNIMHAFETSVASLAFAMM